MKNSCGYLIMYKIKNEQRQNEIVLQYVQYSLHRKMRKMMDRGEDLFTRSFPFSTFSRVHNFLCSSWILEELKLNRKHETAGFFDVQTDFVGEKIKRKHGKEYHHHPIKYCRIEKNL